MRYNRKPSLDNKSNDACTVEHETPSKIFLHVMKPKVIDNEWKCVNKCEDKEGTVNPSMEATVAGKED